MPIRAILRRNRIGFPGGGSRSCGRTRAFRRRSIRSRRPEACLRSRSSWERTRHIGGAGWQIARGLLAGAVGAVRNLLCPHCGGRRQQLSHPPDEAISGAGPVPDLLEPVAMWFRCMRRTAPESRLSAGCREGAMICPGVAGTTSMPIDSRGVLPTNNGSAIVVDKDDRRSRNLAHKLHTRNADLEGTSRPSASINMRWIPAGSQ
jgi:hypothetical protein